MTDTAIVAIPMKDDYVWTISSEKVPHMTLLNLGSSLSSEDVARVTGYIEHAAATSLRYFGMSVDRRGTLGPNDADVVFFEDRWTRDIEEFRGYLLTDPAIKTAFNTSPQFEGWKPHLTLGYPESPAHPDPRDYPGISYVHFDKIALWTGDFEGPEFQLLNNDDLEVAMSEQSTDAIVDRFLAHHGIKGMKWGRRRGRNVQARFGGAKKTSHPESGDHAAVKDLRGKPVHALSNKELRQLNERLNLEKNFNSLTPGTVEKGSKEANKVLDTIGIGAKAFNLVNSPAGKAAVGIGTTLIAGKIASKDDQIFLDRLMELYPDAH